MPIYTKKGDKGETGLPGKRRLAKTEPLFELLGNLDQTSATIGLALASIEPKENKLRQDLENIQRQLLGIGACLAAETPETAAILTELPGAVALMEQQIDEWDKALPELKNFILAGGAAGGATLHLARTIARQSERRFHQLPANAPLEPIAVYLNRLSDFLFQAARFYNFRQNQPEPIWQSS